LRTRLSQSHGPHTTNCPTPAPALSRFSSFWRRFKPHGATERNTQSRSQPFSWTRNLVSGILRRRDGSDIQLREVEVPHTAGQPVHFFLFHGSSLSLTPLCTEKLSCKKEEASCQLISNSQYSYHATTQRSSTEHTIVITATTSHCRCFGISCSHRCRGNNKNTLTSSYHRCWMARSSCGLVVLYACSEHRRSTLVTQSKLQNLLLERRCNTIFVIQAGRWTRFLFLINIIYRLISFP